MQSQQPASPHNGTVNFGLGLRSPLADDGHSNSNHINAGLPKFPGQSFSSHRTQGRHQRRPPRRPLSLGATSSPPSSATRHSHSSPVKPTSRPASVDSSLSPHLRKKSAGYFDSQSGSPAFSPRDLDRYPHGQTPQLPYHPWAALAEQSSVEALPQVNHQQKFQTALPAEEKTRRLSRPRVDRFVTAQAFIHPNSEDGSEYSEHSVPDVPTLPLIPASHSGRHPSPTLQVDGLNHSIPHDLQQHEVAALQEKRPQSAGHKLSAFFGWKQSSRGPQSPTAISSDGRSVSPGPLPLSVIHVNGQHHHQGSSSFSGQEHQDHDYDEFYSSGAASPLTYGGHDVIGHVDELLHELRAVSTELAASIRREMELEDEVDRYKIDMPTAPHEYVRRTSDYGSDSGASSTKLPLANIETKLESLEKMRRKAEQEKAQLRMDMTRKVQDGLAQRRTLEMQVQSLEGQLQSHSDRHVNEAIENERQLEFSLRDLRRQLHDERQIKSNFEDLLAGTREEMKSYRTERDHLRDEVVPQLRTKVEVLESQVVEMHRFADDNARMQQELQSLRTENQNSASAKRLQTDTQPQTPRFSSIAEEEEPLSPKDATRSAVTRSNSLARGKSFRHRAGSLSADALPPLEPVFDRIKDVEDQRDALHRTLKALILRQDQLVREHAKRVRVLEVERNAALSGTPRRAAFTSEVQNLRSEVNHLRRRADDALEQKWQCEKGLSGLKMDLDRARQETDSLRDLLRGHNVFVPDRPSSSGSGSQDGVDVHETLDKVYEELQSTHAESMARIQQQENEGDLPVSSEPVHASHARLNTLAAQVQQQLATNNDLRKRLAEAVDRGDSEQQASEKKITELQSTLKAAEERVVTAQGYSEEAVTKQEEHVRTMKEAVSQHGRHGLLTSPVKSAAPSPRTPVAFGPLSLKIPAGRALFRANAPRLVTAGAGATSIAESSRTPLLEKRVRELEKAAEQADEEMQGVVERMNRAQIEVAELQAERDEAMRQTRRLQREILEERERVRALVM